MPKRRPDRSLHRCVDRLRPRPRDLRGGPDRSCGFAFGCLVQRCREWDDKRRREFANDPRNLLAIGATANFDKAFRDASAWLPPNQAFRCEFVARQVSVKAAYRLRVSANETRAMAAVLDHC
jgi:Protein of unknown function (DUF1524)